MKKLAFIVILISAFSAIYSQSFYNGDFENNLAADCEYNLSDEVFNSKMSNVYAFGKTYYGGGYEGEIDIQAENCYVNPQSGAWCIGLANDYIVFTTSDAVAIELTEALTPGNPYQLSFYIFGNLSFSTEISGIYIGESISDTSLGIVIDTVMPIAESWKHSVVNFNASQHSTYITVKNIPGINAWNQVDNFTIHGNTGIYPDKSESNSITVFPNPATDEIKVKLDAGQQLAQFNLISLLGERILSTTQAYLDVSHLCPGIYLVEVVTDKEKSVSRVQIK